MTIDEYLEKREKEIANMTLSEARKVIDERLSHRDMRNEFEKAVQMVLNCVDRELANKRSIEEVTERLEKDIETYKKAYEYEAKTGGHGSSDSGRYEEAEDILEFIKGEEE